MQRLLYMLITYIGTRPFSSKNGFELNKHKYKIYVCLCKFFASALMLLLVDAILIANYAKDNDPSAGSPTETLLRLLLPLNDQV